MFNQIFGGKKWFQSITGWAMLIFVLAETAIPGMAELGALTPETAAMLTGWMEKGAALLGGAGIRKAATSTNTST